jgi:hypothetical protein
MARSLPLKTKQHSGQATRVPHPHGTRSGTPSQRPACGERAGGVMLRSSFEESLAHPAFYNLPSPSLPSHKPGPQTVTLWGDPGDTPVCTRG